MMLKMMKGKLHRAAVTQTEPDYSGSLTVDENLLEAAGILPHEAVLVADCENGNRFETYIIKGERGSGEISLNGAAARRAHLGDQLIICTYAPMSDEEIAAYKPKVILVNESNGIKEIKKF